MEPLCILFAHHRNDPVTREHVEVLRRHNPFPIVPISNAAIHHLPGAIDVADASSEFSDEDPWEACDTMIYRWFRHARSVEAERYTYIEWDTLATMPLREYFADVWDADAAGAQVKTPRSHPYWEWFRRDLGKLPEPMRPHATAVVPVNGVLLSRRALEAVCRCQIPSSIFCELRLGTLLRSCGVAPIEMPAHLAQSNGWRTDLTAVSASPGVYHPVKTLLGSQ